MAEMIKKQMSGAQLKYAMIIFTTIAVYVSVLQESIL